MHKEGKIRLALVCGGRSAERDVSLSGAAEVQKALDGTKYDVKIYDPAEDVARLVADARSIDAAFILLHGRYGEDGTIQGLFDMLDIPYQGSGVLGSALAMDKHLSKVVYESADIPTPQWITLDADAGYDIEDIYRRLGLPVMVKPCSQGSSVGMSRVGRIEELEKAITVAFEWDSRITVEGFIAGREITCGVLGNSVLEALPVVEIIPDSRFAFFDTEAKYLPGATREICPAPLSDHLTEKAQELGIKSHRALNLRGYSRTDMILSKDGRFHVLETNTIPGMTPTSLLPQAADAAGISFSVLLDRLIELAMEDR